MEITELSPSQKNKLESFKSHVWPLADQEHYGENQPKFFKEEFTLIATENSDIVGYVSISIDTGVAQLEPLMVKPDLKGNSIGTNLLKAAEEKAKTLGAHKILLETGSDWLAKKFYEKHGYQVRSILPNHTGRREFVLMDKML